MIRRIQDFSFFKKVAEWQVKFNIAFWNYHYPEGKIIVITENEYKELNGKKKSKKGKEN